MCRWQYGEEPLREEWPTTLLSGNERTAANARQHIGREELQHLAQLLLRVVPIARMEGIERRQARVTHYCVVTVCEHTHRLGLPLSITSASARSGGRRRQCATAKRLVGALQPGRQVHGIADRGTREALLRTQVAQGAAPFWANAPHGRQARLHHWGGPRHSGDNDDGGLLQPRGPSQVLG